MKFKYAECFLSLFFTLAVAFSFGIEASAHDYERSDGKHTYTHSKDIDVSAAEVHADVGNEDKVKKFVLHLAKHQQLIQQDKSLDKVELGDVTELTIFLKRAREGGVFNSGDIYPISVVSSRKTILNHGRYPGLYGNKYDDKEDPLKTLLGDDVPEFSDSVVPKCASYEYDGKQRVACAVKQQTGTEVGVATTMAGFHHAETDAVVVAPDCTGLNLATTATQVENEKDPDKKKELLKQYVKGFIDAFKKLEFEILESLAKERPELLANPRELLDQLTQRFLEKSPCFTKGDFRNGSIYPFIMDPTRGVAFYNALDTNLNGLSVALTDPDPIQCDGANVLTAFQNAINFEDLAEGNSGFVTYRWNDPDNPNDDNKDFLAKGEVPGTSIKQSYMEVADLLPPQLSNKGFDQLLLVFGSGYYLDKADKENCESTTDDDGGCAIAAGTGSALQGALLNLFLVASVLLPAVFLRKRA